MFLFAVSTGVSWEEWWTYDGISGELNFTFLFVLGAILVDFVNISLK